jgi:hypothetical protein
VTPSLKRFGAEQAAQVGEADREAFVQETVASTEGEIVARLQVLLQGAGRASVRGTLAAVLARVPARALVLILAENTRHRFLPDAQVEQLLAELSLGRVVELLAFAGPVTGAALFGRAPVLARVRAIVASRAVPAELLTSDGAALLGLALADGWSERELEGLALLLSTLVERGEHATLGCLLQTGQLPEGVLDRLRDRHLRELWRRHGPAVTQVPTVAYAVARRLIVLWARAWQPESDSVVEVEVKRLFDRLFDRIAADQLWELVCFFVQQRPPEERSQSFAALLDVLDPQRLAGLLGAHYSEAEIQVYWPLFPEAVRRELTRQGKGRVWGRPGPERSAREPRRAWSRYQQRRRASQPERPAETRRALEMMVRLFGFDASMTYEEAKRRYWMLATKWHPDRVGDDPVLERRIKDLNSAWAAAKDCFAKETRCAAC